MILEMKMKKLVGIDYSLTSPAICVTDDFKFEYSHFYFLTNKKKHLGKFGNIIGYEHQPYTDPIQRFTQISDWVLKVLKLNHSKDNIDTLAIAIENYSYGSKGQALFQIAENCGILKYRLAEEKYKYSVIVPSVVKKLATGKGNADKEMMYEQFCKDTKTDLKKLLDTAKAGNPVSDIVDSWYIAKAHYGRL